MLSIIIPTRNRPDHLRETLEALAIEASGQRFEVIVVDDGSTPGSLQHLSAGEWPFSCCWLEQENRGPAAARNRGLAAATSQRVLFLGDDTRPAPGGLKPHLISSDLGIQGHIDWDPARETTDLMGFLAPEGHQFYFKGLRDGQQLPFTAVLGSNFSAPKKWFDSELFDESFPHAALEDTELAFRFHRRGWQTVYRPAALCWHHHLYTDLEPFLARQERAGQSARYATGKHSGLLFPVVLKPLLFSAWVGLRRIWPRKGKAEEKKNYWDFRCRQAFFRGFIDGPSGTAEKSHR